MARKRRILPRLSTSTSITFSRYINRQRGKHGQVWFTARGFEEPFYWSKRQGARTLGYIVKRLRHRYSDEEIDAVLPGLLDHYAKLVLEGKE